MGLKFKALRKIETKEFVEIQKFNGMNVVFTSELPNPQPMTATLDLMKQVYEGKFPPDFDFDDYELVEFDCNESGVIGADIRNKLSPPKSLVSFLERYFDKNNEIPNEKLLIHIKKSMEQTKINIDYLANLL